MTTDYRQEARLVTLVGGPWDGRLQAVEADGDLHEQPMRWTLWGPMLEVPDGGRYVMADDGATAAWVPTPKPEPPDWPPLPEPRPGLWQRIRQHLEVR